MVGARRWASSDRDACVGGVGRPCRWEGDLRDVSAASPSPRHRHDSVHLQSRKLHSPFRRNRRRHRDRPGGVRCPADVGSDRFSVSARPCPCDIPTVLQPGTALGSGGLLPIRTRRRSHRFGTGDAPCRRAPSCCVGCARCTAVVDRDRSRDGRAGVRLCRVARSRSRRWGGSRHGIRVHDRMAKCRAVRVADGTPCDAHVVDLLATAWGGSRDQPSGIPDRSDRRGSARLHGCLRRVRCGSYRGADRPPCA